MLTKFLQYVSSYRDRNNTYISTMKGGLKSSQPPCFPVSNVGQITDPPSSVPKRASQAISIHKVNSMNIRYIKNTLYVYSTNS